MAYCRPRAAKCNWKCSGPQQRWHGAVLEPVGQGRRVRDQGRNGGGVAARGGADHRHGLRVLVRLAQLAPGALGGEQAGGGRRGQANEEDDGGKDGGEAHERVGAVLGIGTRPPQTWRS